MQTTLGVARSTHVALTFPFPIHSGAGVNFGIIRRIFFSIIWRIQYAGRENKKVLWTFSQSQKTVVC